MTSTKLHKNAEPWLFFALTSQVNMITGNSGAMGWKGWQDRKDRKLQFASWDLQILDRDQVCSELQFCPQVSPKWVLAPNLAFLDEHFQTIFQQTKK